MAFDYTHKRQSGGRGQYGKVTGYFEPLSHDEVQEILTKYQGEITPMNASKYLAIFQNKIRVRSGGAGDRTCVGSRHVSVAICCFLSIVRVMRYLRTSSRTLRKAFESVWRKAL